MKKHTVCTIVGLGLLSATFIPGDISGGTINVPGDQPTIQAAVDAAGSGDTVLIAEGTFSGQGNRDISFGGTSLTIMGQGADGSTIDCGGAENDHHGAFVFNAGDTGVTISRLSITGAYFQLVGHDSGAITCVGGSPTIRECRIRNNRSHGISIVGATAPFFVGLEISFNDGWGINMPGYPYLSVGVIVGYCRIDHNKLGGMILTRAIDTTLIQANTIADNGGDGLFLQGDLPQEFAGGIDDLSADISRNLIAFNAGRGIYLTGYFPGVRYRRNLSFANGDSNFLGLSPDTICMLSADPLFCRVAGAQEYQVSESSPCVNNSCGMPIGALRIGCTSCCVTYRGNVDCDPNHGVDISDLSRLIDRLFISFAPLCCAEAANVDAGGSIDISDLSRMIDFLYISFSPLGNCP